MTSNKTLFSKWLYFTIINLMVGCGTYLYDKNQISYFLEKEAKKVLNITLEKIELSKNLLESLSMIISKGDVNNKVYISRAIKESYDTGYDIGTYKGVKSSGIYWFSEDGIVSKIGNTNNPRLYQLLKNIKYDHGSFFRIVPITNYTVQGLVVSMAYQDNDSLKGSINLILTNYSIKESMDKILEGSIEYMVLGQKESIVLSSKGFKNPFYNFQNFTIFDILNNENRIYTYMLRHNIANEDYFFTVGIVSNIITKIFVKHILYACMCLNLIIFILWHILHLIYLKIESKIHKNYEGELKRLAYSLHQVETEYSLVKTEAKLVQDYVKTITISNEANQLLIKQKISNITLKLQEVNNIINIFIKSINGELKVVLTTQKEVSLLREIDNIINNFFLDEIHYSQEEANIKTVIDNVYKIYSRFVFENQIELKVKYECDLKRIFIDALSLKQLLIALITYSLRGLGKKGKIELILSKIMFHNMECLKINLADNGFGLDLNSELITENSSVDEKILGALSVFLPTIEILKDIISKTRGRLEYVSKLNEGTYFTLIIPLIIEKKYEDNKSSTECLNNVTYLFS